MFELNTLIIQNKVMALESFHQDLELSVECNFLFLAPKQSKNDAGFKWNMHRLHSHSAKARKIVLISMSHG